MIMKMKRFVLSSVVMLLSVMMLAGCIRGGTTDDVDPPIITDPPVVTLPVKEEFTKYFNSSVYNEYLTVNSTVKDVDGSQKNFEVLAQRQVELLATDILYRLFATYGMGAATENAYVSTYKLTYGGQIFSLNNNYATVHNGSILQTPISEGVYKYTTGEEYRFSNNTESPYRNPNFLEVAPYAHSLTTGQWVQWSELTKAFYLKNAIVGGHPWDENSTTYLRTEYSWNWNYNQIVSSLSSYVPKTAFEVFYNDYYNTFKTALANLLAGGSATGYSYETAISKIEHLGLTNSDKTAIANYIYNQVIGSTLVQFDDGLKTSILQKFSNGVLTLWQLGQMTEDEHYYRAYKLLVPAIIDQAANLTFENTTTKIYVNGEKSVIGKTNTAYNALNNKNFTFIKLTPKTNNIPLTKLVMNFNGVSSSNLTVRYTVKTSSSESAIISNQLLTLPSSTSNATVTIDFANYATYKLSSTGSIELAIVNSANTNFNVVLDGYYNKI